MTESIVRSTSRIAAEIADGRTRAHAKHGEASIESEHPLAIEWVAILGEEFGELAHEYTYDAGRRVDVYSGLPLSESELIARRMERIRAEAMDVATVAVALVAAIDRARDHG